MAHLAKYSNDTQWCGLQCDITSWHIEILIFLIHPSTDFPLLYA